MAPRTGFCSTEGCENESTREVRVSIDETAIKTRRMCGLCEEAYSKGVQHGHFRAVRLVRAMGHGGVADLLAACLGEPETHAKLPDPSGCWCGAIRTVNVLIDTDLPVDANGDPIVPMGLAGQVDVIGHAICSECGGEQ